MKEVLKSLLKVFVYVSTGSLIAATVIVCLISRLESVDTSLLWQILVVSAACAPASLIFDIGRKHFVFKLIIHYILINIIVIGGGVLFHWFEFRNALEVIITLAIVAAVYACVTISLMRSSKHESDKINEKLKDRRK